MLQSGHRATGVVHKSDPSTVHRTGCFLLCARPDNHEREWCTGWSTQRLPRRVHPGTDAIMRERRELHNSQFGSRRVPRVVPDGRAQKLRNNLTPCTVTVGQHGPTVHLYPCKPIHPSLSIYTCSICIHPDAYIYIHIHTYVAACLVLVYIHRYV